MFLPSCEPGKTTSELSLVRLLSLVLTVVLSACAVVSDEKPGDRAAAEPQSQVGVDRQPESAVKQTRREKPLPPPDDVWERMRRQLVFHTQHNSQIGAAREHYLRQTRFMELIEPRVQRYLYYLVEEVEARDMPVDLALLPLVESAMNPFAYSNQRAAGLWQFMPATAAYLGMRVDWWYDARLDVRESTRFALDYLETLHAEFDDDWLLALAAYNSGKGRVRRAIRRNREAGLPTDYWSLQLPRETRQYVPRLIALSVLVAFDEALGIEWPAVPNRPTFTTVDTGGQIEMLRAAQLAGLELVELRRFNPGQLRWATAPNNGDELLVPLAVAEKMRAGLAALPDSERVTWEHYRIRQGDSLIRIAKRFDTQVAMLREVNNIRGHFIRAGDTLMIPNSAAWRASLAMADTGRTGVRRGYTVQRGDSLYLIANRFGVSIDDIIAWNALDPGRYLQPGQSLTLFLGGG